MDRIRSYKDLKPPYDGEQFPLSDEPLKPLETASRRSHLQKYIVRVMPSFNKLIDVEWKKAESKICENLASEGYVSVSEPWFEYQVDKIVCLHFFSRFKAFVDRDVPAWPWEDITDKDLKSPQDESSSVYDEYLKSLESEAQKSNPVEKSTLAQDMNEVRNVEGPATERRVLPSSKLNPRALEFRPLQDGGRRQTGPPEFGTKNRSNRRLTHGLGRTTAGLANTNTASSRNFVADHGYSMDEQFLHFSTVDKRAWNAVSDETKDEGRGIKGVLWSVNPSVSEAANENRHPVENPFPVIFKDRPDLLEAPQHLRQASPSLDPRQTDGEASSRQQQVALPPVDLTAGEPSGRAWVATRSGKRAKYPVNRGGKQEGDVDMDASSHGQADDVTSAGSEGSSAATEGRHDGEVTNQ